jgi:hypothetical protein
VKVRLIKNARLEKVPSILMLQGSTLDIPDTLANEWINSGHAVLYQEIETATLPQPETAVLRKSKKG